MSARTTWPFQETMGENQMASQCLCIGKALCWECTCVATFASIHVNESAVQAGSVANSFETLKRTIY